MIDAKLAPDEKIRQARRLFEQCLEHYQYQKAEIHRAAQFYNNTRGEGQWDETDLKYLRDQGRPALTFNQIQPKINTILGMQSEVARRPVAVAAGREDEFKAQVWNAILERMVETVGLEGVNDDVRLRGFVVGECNVHIDVETDPKDPAKVKTEVFFVDPLEVNWDPDSRRKDRSDAKYVFWDRWLNESDFKARYPDKADQWDELKSNHGAYGDPSDHWSNDLASSEGYEWNDDAQTSMYDNPRTSRYYDSKRNEVRVVHCEYKWPRKQKWAVNVQSGLSEPIDDELASVLRDRIELGASRDVEIRETWVEDVYWLEFASHVVLFDDVSPQPYEGTSLQCFGCFYDWEEGVNYGYARNLMDPQLEVNKAHSQSLDHLIGQAAPGYIIEESAVTDHEAFDEQVSQSASNAWVKDNSIAENRIKERTVPTFSPGAAKRLEDGLAMIDRISGISSEVETPAAHAEAAATVQIRYRKSMLALVDVFKGWDSFQKGIYRTLMQIVMRAYSDRQIEELLGAQGHYVVQQGMVIEVEEGEDGQQKAVNQCEIRDLRTVQYDLDLESTAENTSVRLMELQTLSMLAQAGVPVDPQIMVARAVNSRYEREALESYARQAGEAQSQQAQSEQQLALMQLQDVSSREWAKLNETQRHQQTEERLQAAKQDQDFYADMAAVYEKADASEKQAVIALLQQGRQQQSAGGQR